MKDEGSNRHPDSARPLSSRKRRSEFDFIEQIRRRAFRRKENGANKSHSALSTQHSALLKGIGDDAAVMRASAAHDILITADFLVEDIDFRRDWVSPRLLGHKALAVSLSDVAAMGARPRWALLSIGVPRDVWQSRFLDGFYEGFFALADEYEVTLIGGDVSRTPEKIVVDSIVLGEARRKRTVFRSGAQIGDRIYVTGALGGAAAGLRLLESGARLSKNFARKPRLNATERLMLRQLRPDARVAWGRLLSEEKLATAMIDLSDGLSSDVAHLCRASSVGATIEAARIPVDPLIESADATIFGDSSDDSPDSLALSLHGGEDYELLFTVNPRKAARVPGEVDGVPATYIGDVTEKAGRVHLVEGKRRLVLMPSGFNHFKPRQRK
ncbi:MAG TPA: thiamine-phosphate kinase [Pyrinomonadaceae bacterium]|jgi:thiamine-monophosphate kinase|nr:thiamine-phosphate kinase [Pyrinomonadaceae bacterium]